MYLPVRLWHHCINISRVHVFTCKALASPFQHFSCTCIYLQGCGITVPTFLVYMYLPARLWHHCIHIPHVHVFTCKAVASQYPYSSCTCIYLQGCGITVSIFLVYMYLPVRLWHHHVNILVYMTVFTCKIVASPYPYSSCTCIYLRDWGITYPYSSCTCNYLQDCGITVSIFLVYMYLPARLWHYRIHIPHVHVFNCKAVALPYQHFSYT